MYKYIFTAAVNADKENFYSVVNELKEMYPEMAEDNNAPSDSKFLRREFYCGQKRVMVQYSFSERSVTVFSEDWLGKFYENKEVSEGRFSVRSESSTGAMWAISGIFFAATAIVSFFTTHLIFYASNNAMRIALLVLAAIYTVSGILIRRSIDIPLLKLAFCQAGGFISVIIGLIALNVYLLDVYLPIHIFSFIAGAAAIAMLYLMALALIFLPALEISFIIQAVIVLIMKKIYPTKTVANASAKEDIAEADNVH